MSSLESEKKIYGKAIIFSAPSGAGKTTLVNHLLENNTDLEISISAATRKRRNEVEKEGKDYHFFTVSEFRKKIENREFVEWEQVYPGKFYGTLQSELERVWSAGKNIIFDVDVKGGISLKKYFRDKALSVFINPPSLDTLKERLLNRNTETPQEIAVRLSKIAYEMSFSGQFDVVLLNNDLELSKKQAQKFYDTLKKR